jgi:L-alanine-DL-glutamate epimerase-like enolase superfamily enzyme
MAQNRFDVRPVEVALYFLPVETRVPLKFGAEVVTAVTCARVCMRVVDRQGRSAEGWAETPLAVQWTWPSDLTYEVRNEVLQRFCVKLAEAWAAFELPGHPIEVGHAFQQRVLPKLLAEVNAERDVPMPWLAALVCCSAFDNALHDAYGKLLDKPIYETYGPPFMNRDLAYFLEPAADGVNQVSFQGKYPEDFLVFPRPDRLPAWHLVGGLDLLTPDERTGDEPDDGYPVVLTEWIKRDGLTCLKIKLRGTDADWDYGRLVQIGEIAIAGGVDWLTSDFNCTVRDPAYVNAILDRLMAEHPRIYGMILYVEQPFPYDLAQHRIDVHSVSARKPLFMDESAHDWRLVKLGRSLGWTGVALKTCKTQTGALLSLCWAKAHGMTLMVQDLTNPMLAQIPHVLLAAHAGTIMGVETNAMQFYPEASLSEAEVHPGLYQRRQGCVDLSTLQGPGFGYRLDEIERTLPDPVLVVGAGEF